MINHELRALADLPIHWLIDHMEPIRDGPQVLRLVGMVGHYHTAVGLFRSFMRNPPMEPLFPNLEVLILEEELAQKGSMGGASRSLLVALACLVVTGQVLDLRNNVTSDVGMVQLAMAVQQSGFGKALKELDFSIMEPQPSR